ncbi:hypothetical protein CYY_002395 [Polysphondylium violaceum]|uniref:FNIP repeat-containing protein n=1 Tax=Polysphondylium violaceum TaxID=133409 RepID=A0A8J4PZE8_9MYCE|nr:hypothetical protein CYY_002395 [Polysphondylium violaceum]
MDYLFNQIYRNPYLKQIIRKHLCSNVSIRVSIEYLINNYNYLSCKDYTLNICLGLEGLEMEDQYMALDEKYRNLVTELYVFQTMEPTKFSQLLQLLPSNIRHLNQNNSEIGQNCGPDLTELYLSLYFGPTTPLEKNMVPSTIKKLDLSGYHHTINQGVLPDSIEKITFYYNTDNLTFFNESVLPENKSKPVEIELNMLKDLEQRPVFNTKYNITQLYLRLGPTIEVDSNLIPSTVTKLTFAYLVVELKPNVIPHSVTDLELSDYNLELKVGSLPPNLKIFKSYYYNQPFEPFVLPNTLTYIELDSFNQQLDYGVLPTSLVTLKLYGYSHGLAPGILPDVPSLKSLALPSFDDTFSQDMIPSSLTLLHMRYTESISILPHFPASLKHLRLSNFNGNGHFLNQIPTHIETLDLIFSYLDSRGLECPLPQHLKTLRLTDSAPNSIPSQYLPQSLRKLVIEKDQLTFEPAYEGQECVYPPTLQYLGVYPQFKTGNLPKSLVSLYSSLTNVLQHFE